MNEIKGKIYCITNVLNGKQYVGKTLGTIEKRFKEHIKEKNRSTERPLYRAMNKYGIENFSIELLEECDYKQLANREQYWIKEKNSYHNGYNATLGGDGKVLYNYEDIVEKYRSGMMVKELANYFECSIDTIRLALHGAEIDLFKNKNKSQKKKVILIKENEEKVFDSCYEAAHWLKDNNFTEANSIEGIAANIGKVANGKRKSYLKFVWKWQ